MTDTPEYVDGLFKSALRKIFLYDFEEQVAAVDRKLHDALRIRDLPEYQSALEALRTYADAIDRRIDKARRTGK